MKSKENISKNVIIFLESTFDYIVLSNHDIHHGQRAISGDGPGQKNKSCDFWFNESRGDAESESYTCCE